VRPADGNSSRKRSRIKGVLITLLFCLVAVGLFSWYIHQRLVQNALDRSLFSIIFSKDNAGLTDALEAGADPNADLSQPYAKPSILEVAKGLFRARKPAPRSRPLDYAVDWDDQIAVTLLLSHKADPNLGVGSFPLLRQACSQPDALAMMETLLKHGAKVNVKDATKTTPLHYAAYEGDSKLVRFMLAYHADVNARNFSGGTPFRWALGGRDSHATMIALLEKGADINATYEDGATALMLSVEAKSNEDVAFLLAHGAKVLKYTGKKAAHKNYYKHPFIMAQLRKIGKTEP
jgi:ankyrin repeat protein